MFIKRTFHVVNTIAVLVIGFYAAQSIDKNVGPIKCYNCTDCFTVNANTSIVDGCGGCTIKATVTDIVRGCVASCTPENFHGPYCCTTNLCNNRKEFKEMPDILEHQNSDSQLPVLPQQTTPSVLKVVSTTTLTNTQMMLM
uniref:Uncharacterized protein n=1 Tax=Trichobilharzia regenti TaxID=157069 RepID=A0AA85K399_TRIRE|nr:unnamed protein product [Trichobilharzia regenti]